MSEEEEKTQSLLNQERGKMLKKDVADRVSLELLYENITIDNLDNDGNDNPIGINGIPWEQMHIKHLHTICSRLLVRGVENAEKAFIIDTMTRWCCSRGGWNYDSQTALYEANTAKASGRASPSARKEVQCTFSLINILFSNEFVGEFAALGNVVASREECLDSGKGGNNQLFWECVQDAFAEPDNSDHNHLFVAATLSSIMKL
jgi:hypothetical protein